MLFSLPGEIQATQDNFGATVSDTGIGTSMTAGAANVQGTPVTLLSGATVANDVFGIGILFAGGSASATVRRYLMDLLIDPAGGTSWSTVISSLAANSPALTSGGYRYFFPLWLKAGTSIGMSAQCSAASATIRCAIQLYGQPRRVESVIVGTRVETFGDVRGTTSGTTISPGSGVVGAYASLGTTASDLWWWQTGGLMSNDTTILARGTLIDVAAGDATNKLVCLDNCIQNFQTTEQCGKDSMGGRIPIRRITAGQTVYSRASGTTAADTTPTTTAYGLGN